MPDGPFIKPKSGYGLVFFPAFQQSTEILSAPEKNDGVDLIYTAPAWPTYTILRWHIDPSENAADLYGVPDEDQVNQRVVVIQQFMQRVPLPWISSDDQLKPIPDEDQIWQNPLQLLLRPFGYPQQAIFDSQEPFLYGMPDEDQRTPLLLRLFPFFLSRTEPWSFDNNGLGVTNEEDFWQNPLFQCNERRFIWTQQFNLDAAEIAFSPIGDDDQTHWQLLSLSSWMQVRTEPWSIDDVGLGATWEEEYWRNPLQSLVWVFKYPQQTQFEQHEIPPPPPISVEDFWVNAAIPYIMWEATMRRQWNIAQREMMWVAIGDQPTPVLPVIRRVYLTNMFDVIYLPLQMA